MGIHWTFNRLFIELLLKEEKELLKKIKKVNEALELYKEI